VDSLLATVDPSFRLVINLDDRTIVRDPPRPALPSLSGGAGGRHGAHGVPDAGPDRRRLLVHDPDNIQMSSSRTLTIGGRLDCGTFTIGGAGSINLSGTLGTMTASANGLGATVVNTGSKTYLDGSIIEYNAMGPQTINATNHPCGIDDLHRRERHEDAERRQDAHR
jgi:hypothetical protein